MRILGVILAFTLSFPILTNYSHARLTCSMALQNEHPLSTRSYEQIRQLRLMSYNVENLFVTSFNRDKYKQSRPEESEGGFFIANKSQKAIDGVGEAIRETNPDILVLQEVENLEALQLLNQTQLNGKYKSYLLEGNDERGIEIGFMVKADLPFHITHESHKNHEWNDPFLQKKIKVFSRDLPALVFRKSANDAPFLIVIGNHGKSKRDRMGDHESNILRTAQYESAAQIISKYKKIYGDKVNIVMAGDFNTDVQKAPEVKPIRDTLTDAFDVAQKTVPRQERITHTFHPFDGPTVYAQLDGIFVSNSLRNAIIQAEIYHYKHPNGDEKNVPRSFRERKKNPSDHIPPWIDFLTDGMF